MEQVRDLAPAEHPAPGVTTSVTPPQAGTDHSSQHRDQTELFLEHRQMLAALAYRLLGSVHDADDTVQDAYLRWATVDPESIANPAAFLTTVTTRLALDRLRSAKARREIYVGPWLPEPLPTSAAAPGTIAPSRSASRSGLTPDPAFTISPPTWTDPVETVALRESATIGMLLLVERLSPVERAVFVLREAFALPYEEIAAIVDRSPAHCRQLHHRATLHAAQAPSAQPSSIRTTTPARAHPSSADPHRGRALVEKFLSAARGGDMDGLKALLRDDVVLTTDGGGQVSAALRPIFGAQNTARLFASVFTRRHQTAVATYTEFNYAPAILLSNTRRPSVYVFDTDDDGCIANVYGIFNPDKLRHLAIPSL